MATIEKRGDSYRIKVSCGYDSAGKQIIKSKTWRPSTNMTPKQIERELNRVSVEFENDVMNGNVADTANLKLADFCDQYLELSKINLAPTTYSVYKRCINTLIIPALGHFKVCEIKPIHVQRFIQILGEEGACRDSVKNHKTIKKTLSPSSIQRYFVVLKSIMAKAYKLGLCTSNPTDTARLDLPPVEETEVEVFSHEEAANMLQCLNSEPLMFQLLIHTAIVTGCRRGELVALKWDCINTKNKSIIIKQSNFKLTGEEIKTKSPKTQKSVREIAVPEYLLNMFDRYRTEQTAIIA